MTKVTIHGPVTISDGEAPITQGKPMPLIDDIEVLEVMRLGRLAGIDENDIAAWRAWFTEHGITFPR